MQTDNPVVYFDWPVGFNGDVPFSHVRSATDFRLMDYDNLIWYNNDFAKMAELTYKHELGTLEPGVEHIFPAVRQAMMGADGRDWFKKILVRPPYTEYRCADHLERALSRVLRYNEGTHTFMLYDASTGIWQDSSMSWGATVNSSIDSIISEFGRALSRAADLLKELFNLAVPDPGPKPQPGAALTAWNAVTASRKETLEKIERISKMSRAIFDGKYIPILNLLKRRLGLPQEAWDSDMSWLILRDGVVNVKEVYETQEINWTKFSPEHMSTMALEVGLADAVHSGAESEWDRGVAKVLPDPEVRKYLQKRFGAALLGKPGLAGKSMVWQFGVGDTAKSTIQECIAGSRGVFAPYSVTSSSNALTKNGERTGATERFKAYARGKRFAIMSELDDGSQLAQGDLKLMTGGETVEGTAKYSNAVEYFFTATIFMASNHPPTFPPGDTAARGRIHVVPFTHKLFIRSKDPVGWAAADEMHRADEGWADKVLGTQAERAAILRWVLDGLIYFAREGLGELPEAMQEASEEFAADADPVSKVINSLLGKEPGYENAPLIVMYTDADWDSYGYYERDGLTVKQLEALFETRAFEMGLVSFGDKIPAKWMNAAKSMLHEIGGKKKKIKLSAETSTYAYSRVKLVTTPLGLEHHTAFA